MDLGCTVPQSTFTGEGGVISDRGSETALEERVMCKGKGEQDREVQGDVSTFTTRCGAVPEAIVIGGERAGDLVRGLEGREGGLRGVLLGGGGGGGRFPGCPRQ